MMKKNRRGFALLTALWLVVAIAAAGLQLALESRRSMLAATNLTHDIQARNAASAAVDLTRARVDLALRRATENSITPNTLAISDAWMNIDSIYSITERIGALDVEISVSSLGKKMNINRASESELLNFFVAMEISYSDAEELAQCIMDWRDTDGQYRARGAEREFYEAEGLLVLPRNNLFESVDELRYVYGMTQETFELIEPYVTVWGSGRINLNTAERPVLLSLTGMNEGAVSRLITLRQSGERLNDLDDLDPYLGGANLPNNRTAVLVDELEIEARATAGDGKTILRAFGVIRRGTGQSSLTNWRVE
jgi:general secretion pathway protein K